MTRIEKTIFISYRRTNLPWALAIFQNLKSEGYDVFFDYLSIPSGDFEKIIIENIKARAHFVVILTPSALERCNEPGDWLRREIETAMDEKRNIIPLMLESFDFGIPSTTKALTGKLENLKKYNGLRLHSEYFFEGMNRLREKYLNVSLEAIVHPIPENAIPITEEHQLAANEAAAVEKEQLTAQEWYEKGFKYFDDDLYDEAIRCVDEAIKLDSTFAAAFALKGNTYIQKYDYDQAIANLDKSIQLDSSYAYSYILRGIARVLRGDSQDTTIKDYNEGISRRPNDGRFYSSRGLAYRAFGLIDKALNDFSEAIRLEPDSILTYHRRAKVWEKKKNYSKAIADYQKYLELGGGMKNDNQKEVENTIKKLKSKLTKKKPARKKQNKKGVGFESPLLLLLIHPSPHLHTRIRQLILPRREHLHRAHLELEGDPKGFFC